MSLFRSIGRPSSSSSSSKQVNVIPPPLTELASCIERLEYLISRVILPNNKSPSNKSTTTSVRAGKATSPLKLSKHQQQEQGVVVEEEEEEKEERQKQKKKPKVDFVILSSSKEEEEWIELLRRIAELVVLSEQKSSSSSTTTTTTIDIHPQQQEAFVLLEYFYERNTLDLIVGLITGEVFSRHDSINNNNNKNSSSSSLSSMGSTNSSSSFHPSSHSTNLLPFLYLSPIPIAIQAVQTISILLQNVIHPTSLYLLLSNNRLGSLIHLSFDLYSTAIHHHHHHHHMTQEKYQQYEIELFEFTTHFISLLKSIALRINSDTLQFFLVYPWNEENQEDVNDDDMTSTTSHKEKNPINKKKKKIKNRLPTIEFPLYTKALSFVSSSSSSNSLYDSSSSSASSSSYHQNDSFVRITAFNICMNLIRASSLVVESPSSSATIATTITRPRTYSETVVASSSTTTTITTISPKVPNAGTLSNFPSISIQDRLAILQYICLPARVELLVSSIFLNIATICTTSLEESIIQLYTIEDEIMIYQEQGGGGLEEKYKNLDPSTQQQQQQGENNNNNNNKTFKVSTLFQQRKDCINIIRNLATDIEDELLLLNDILKIGLFDLNEQIVEKVITSLMYPQLLQPLHSWLQYYHEQEEKEEVATSTAKTTTTITSNSSIDPQKQIMIAQATTALFLATILFQTITHKPTLHVIFTALCHPKTPHESKSYIVSRRSLLFRETANFIAYENESIHFYDFSHDFLQKDSPQIVDKKNSSTLNKEEVEEDTSLEQQQATVFILSPALFILFQLAIMKDTNDVALIETQMNPYRSAFLTILSLSSKLPLLSKVATYLLDSMFTCLSPSVVKHILLMNEDDSSLVYELMSSLFSNLITESISSSGFATLDFDLTTAHTILCLSILNVWTHEASEKLVCLEYIKTISFLSHLPHFITENLASSEDFASSKENHTSSHRYGSIMYNLFYGSSDGRYKCVVESLNQWHDIKEVAFVRIARDQSNGDICSVFADESRFKAIHGNKNVHIDSVNSVLAIIKVATLRNLIKSGSIAHYNFNEGQSLAQALNDCFRNAPLSDSKFATGREFLCPLPESWTDILFGDQNRIHSLEETAFPIVGTVVSFDGKLSFPCVVEITTEFYPLIVDKASCIIADGVRWLSLYLVLFGNYFILAEPSTEDAQENGRIVSSCCMENLQVIEDNPMEIQNASPARRLVFTYTSFSSLSNNVVPELFTPLNIEPTPWSALDSFRQFPKSTIDLWFENIKAARLALNTINTKIDRLRSRMGQEIFEKIITQKLDEMPAVVEAKKTK